MALEKDPSLRKAQNNLALVLHKNKELDLALEKAKTLCAQHPLYVTGWNTLAAIAIDLKDYAQAQEALDRAHALDPYSVSVLVNYGNLAYLQQRYDDAKLWWERALLLDPDQKHAQAGLKHLQSFLPQ